jgi:hypothetical protein
MFSRISQLISNYKEGNFSKEDLNELGKSNSDELIEILKIEDITIRNFLVKAYFTTYNNKIVNEAEEKFEDIDKIFAEVWIEEALQENPDNITKAYLGITFLTTDFISRIRNKISTKDNLNKFESQIYETIKFLKDKAEKETFFSTIFAVKSCTDESFLNSMQEADRNWACKIKENFVFINTIWLYYFSVADGNENIEYKSLISESKNKLNFARNMLPEEVFINIKKLLEKEDIIDMSMAIQTHDHDNDTIIDNDKEKFCKSNIKKDSFENSLNGFKDKIKNNVGKKPSKRKLFNKAPQKRGNGKIIMISVLVMMATSVSFAVIMNKTTKVKDLPIQEVILKDGLKAEVNLKEDLKEEKKSD